MNIAGLQKLTTSDFPGVLSCIVFTQGCNLRCPYCQNSGLIPLQQASSPNFMNLDQFFDFLVKRKSILEGVVITGGEPLVQKDIKDFIIQIKEQGYKVKLDTNGTNPLLLKELIDSHLLDYVAVDIKNDFDKYAETVGLTGINTDSIKQTIEILKSSNIDFEFRTTVMKEFHTITSIENICKAIGNSSKYFIQNFEDSDNVINHNLHGFSHEELENLQKHFEEDYPLFKVRGI